MSSLRSRCVAAIQPFLERYERKCEEFDLPESRKLYRTVADALLKALPETDRTPPYPLSERRIREILSKARTQCPQSNLQATELALHRMLLIGQSEGLLEGRMVLRQRVRREEIPIHSEQAFALLDDFHRIRCWLLDRIQRVPRERKELPQLVIASLIALNGVLLPGAVRKIGACRIHDLRDIEGQVFLQVPVGRLSSRVRPSIQYPLLPQIHRLIGHLKGKNDWLFPGTWTPDASYGKAHMTRRMNRWLIGLWHQALGPGTPVPESWNLSTFIMCSRLYFALHLPPAVVAHLCGRSTYATFAHTRPETHGGGKAQGQTVPTTSHAARSPQDTPGELAEAQLMIDHIGALLREIPPKSGGRTGKRQIACAIAALGLHFDELTDSMPIIRYLTQWIISELLDERNHAKMGRFQAMWRYIPSMLLNELGGNDPAELDADEWLRLAEYLIQENTYSAATRSKIKQHLRSFHAYLRKQRPGQVPAIDWRLGVLRVDQEPAENIFPTLSEFDRLYVAAGRENPREEADVIQAALVLAFFGGLRAGEITLLDRMDLDATSWHLRVWWSKTRKGRRRVHLGLLTPRYYLGPVARLYKRSNIKEAPLVSEDGKTRLSPDALSQRVARLTEKHLPEGRRMSLHAFRHGFASWLLVRYFALIEPDLITTLDPTGQPWIPDAGHRIFHPSEQKKLVRVFNGRVAGERYAQDPTSFISKPEHFAMISRMIGHATRDTTARTYIHSMPWISRYYLHRLSAQSGRYT